MSCLAQVFSSSAPSCARPAGSTTTRSPAQRLAEGAARFRIDGFALTSNNVTYAAFGDAMSYWRFFPAPATHLLGPHSRVGLREVDRSRVATA